MILIINTMTQKFINAAKYSDFDKQLDLTDKISGRKAQYQNFSQQ